jgi:hypothetical protein
MLSSLGFVLLGFYYRDGREERVALEFIRGLRILAYLFPNPRVRDKEWEDKNLPRHID